MVHRRGVHRARGHGDDREGGSGDPEEATGRGADGGGGLQRGHNGAEGNRRAENIATDLATAGLEDMAQNFVPRKRQWSRDRRMWDIRRKGQVVRSRTDYILGTDSRIFRNAAIRDPRHNSDQYMVLGCLPSAPLLETKRYLGGSKRWPVRPPTEPSRQDTLFAALRRAVLKPKPW